MTLLALAVGGRGLVPPGEAVVPADDEGLLRGRAVFETLRVYQGRPFRIGAHLARMEASAARLGIAWPGGFEELAAQALGAAGTADAVLRLYLTAGREGSGPPVSLALVSELPADLEERRARGIALISLLGIRAEAPWLLGGVKSTSYAVNMAAKAEALARGGDDAVFIRDDGVVLEGPVTNVWWRHASILRTPALSLGILAGVTRGALIDAAPGAGYEVEEGEYSARRPARRRGGVHLVVDPRGDAGRRGGRAAVRAGPGCGGAPGGPAGRGAVRRVFLRVMGGVNNAVYRLSRGRVMGRMGKAPILLLTVRGRKTGKRRTTPLLYTRDGDNLVVIASMGGAPKHPAWYLNLEGTGGGGPDRWRASPGAGP